MPPGATPGRPAHPENAAVSRSLTAVQAFVLGALILAGAGLAAGGLFAVGSRAWYGRDAFTVRAGFRDIRGVEVGTRVRIQGIDAGEVTAIAPPQPPDNLVVLHLRLKGELRDLVRTDSTVQIVSEGMIGGKALEIHRGKGGNGPAAQNGDLLKSEASTDLADVLNQVSQTLQGIGAGEGTIGKLARDPRVYDALLGMLMSGKEAAATIQQDADALKRLPLVGGYIEDPVALLVRPGYERNRQVFAEHELFEPGRAVLIAEGRQRLDRVAGWLEGMKHKGSEVVVVSYADPSRKATPQAARAVTAKQSEAVCDYLKNKHGVQKMGWFSSRKVAPLGMGLQPPPAPEPQSLPPARVEVIVFVPQG
jgi:phospholipid/cholesterol/gamma-HCH transport system substrate-binding protein